MWKPEHRRAADRHFERYAHTVVALVRLAMIRIMLRRLTRLNHSTSIPTSWIGSKS